MTLKKLVLSSTMKKSLRDYAIISVLASLILSKLFYDNFYCVAVFIIIFSLFAKKYIDSQLAIEKSSDRELIKDALYSISGSIAAGRQMPSAIEDAANQCKLFDPDSKIVNAFFEMISLYKETNAKLEDLLLDFSSKLEMEELNFFALSYKSCSECGGNLERVCLKSAAMIIEKLEYQKEVSSILSEKKLDIAILISMPILLLFMLNLSSREFLDPLYECQEGRVIMSISLLLIVLALAWSLKIMKLDL